MFRYCTLCYNAEAEANKKICKGCREHKEHISKTAFSTINKPTQSEINRLLEAAEREEKRQAKLAQQNQNPQYIK